MLTDVAANSASGCRSLQRSKCPRCLATVGTDPIPPGDYARLITYTVDAFTHRLQAHLGVDFDDLPLPEETDAPPDPAEEHLLPPDPEDTYPTIDERAALDDYFDDTPPPDPDTLEYPPDEFDGLQFEKLSANRPTPELGISMENLATLREEYRAVCKEITALDADIRAGNGPAMRAAADELLRMRRQVDADRPYAHAVTAVMDQWADADAAYNDILRMIEHARAQLDALYATAEPDDLDIASAQADLAFHTRRLPKQPPSLRCQQAFAEAQAARSAAAGGDKIVTEHDIVIARGDAERADLAARAALNGRRQALRRELERADRDVATAFAAAQTAASDTLETLLDSARCEVELLRAAGHIDFDCTPLAIPTAALASHEPHIADRLKSLAAMPYRLSLVRADSSDRETAAALYTLRSAANANDRKVLWLSTTDEATAPVRIADLADTFTTIGEAHYRISDQRWTLPPGTIIVIDDPADTDPARLAGIAHHAVAADARVIIIDPTATTAPAHPHCGYSLTPCPGPPR